MLCKLSKEEARLVLINRIREHIENKRFIGKGFDPDEKYFSRLHFDSVCSLLFASTECISLAELLHEGRIVRVLCENTGFGNKFFLKEHAPKT